MRRYALTFTAYKFLDIGIVMGPMSYVEIAICDNRDNCTIVLHAMWKARRANIERLMLSTVPPIQDLNVELVKVLGYK